MAENGYRTRVAIGFWNPIVDHQRTPMGSGRGRCCIRACGRPPPTLQKLLVVVAFGALAVVFGELLQQDFDVVSEKIDFCRDVLLGAGSQDDIAQGLLRGEIKRLRGFERNRRLGEIGAIGFAAHPEHVLFERRQAFCKLELETVAAVADRRLFEIGAIAIGKDAADQLVIVGDQQTDRHVRLRVVLRPSGNLPQINHIKVTLQHEGSSQRCPLSRSRDQRSYR